MSRRTSVAPAGGGSGGNMSMTELLAALGSAQRERETALEEMRRVWEAERTQGEAAQARADRLQEELNLARRETQDLSLKNQELENLLKTERENNERQKQKEEEELRNKLEKWKEKFEFLNQRTQDLEKANKELTEELNNSQSKIKKANVSETNLKEEISELKERLEKSNTALDKALKNQEMAEAELHMSKIQVLKETNINNRLLDELKRTRREIDEHKEEIIKLKKSKDSYKNNISQQIKDLSVLITENNKDNFGDDLREMRMTLTNVLKENFVLNSRISDVFKYLTKNEPEVVSVAIQTNLGYNQMQSYEKMDREVTNLVMCLREELITNKSDMIELKQENHELKILLRRLEEERRHREETSAEEEKRVEKLEAALSSLKEMFKETEKVESERDSHDVIIDQLKRDVQNLKRNNIQSHHLTNDIGLSIHPTKLVTFRKY